MLTSRRPTRPIRQHSLQQQPPSRLQQIRRYRSTDDEEKIPTRTKFCVNTKPEIERPKIRFVWGEQHSRSSENEEEQVQIVARQISGKSRSSTVKTSKTFSSKPACLGDKASILYSHQELAERLRLAWKQREESKSNIDIFLAHNTVEDRCESGLSSFTATTTAPSTPLLPRRTSKEIKIPGVAEYNAKFRVSAHNCGKPKVINDSNVRVDDVHEDNFKESVKDTCEDEKEEEKENDDMLQKKMNFEDKKCNKKKPCTSLDCTESIDEINQQVYDYSKSTPKSVEADMSQAKLKRAGFQSGLNKAFAGPLIERPTSSKTLENTNVKYEPKLRRTISSAPGQRRLIDGVTNRAKVNIVIDTPSMTKGHFPEKPTEEKDTVSVITTCDEEPIKSTIFNRSIKSAPLKRRIKSGKRRGFSIGASKEGADNGRPKSRGNKTATESKVTDVVTMVSLISSADSDSDADENTDDKLIHDLRNKLPTAPIIKSSTRPASTTFRKPVKSVSFHQSSFDNDFLPKNENTKDEKKQSPITCTEIDRRNANAPPTVLEVAMTWKPEITSLALPLLQLTQDTNATETPLTDREKRCLVVPICDSRDKKRKLLRTRSAGPKLIEMQRPSISTLQDSQTRISQNYTNSSQPITVLQETLNNKDVESSKIDQEIDAVSSEPSFQTSKEKECWHLYRRMCDKGVCVSFDTVLRGMLTPTEYRLRQKSISQNI